MVSHARNGRLSPIQMTIRTNFGSIVIPCILLVLLLVISSSLAKGILPAKEVCVTCNCLKGIGFAENQVEVSIDCSQKQLVELPVDWPFNMTKGEDLEDAKLVVSFSGNQLGTLRKLPATRAKNVSLSFRYCGLTELVSGAFLDVPFLERLDLSCNSLTTESIHGDVFRGHYDTRSYEPLPLRTLLLTKNSLTNGLSALSLEHMPDLRILDLSYNHMGELSDGTVIAITTVKKLETLDLSHTGISFLPDRIMKSLPNLVELSVRGNNFLSVPASIRIAANTLIKLDFSNNPVTTIEKKSFQSMMKLQQLNLNHMMNLTAIKESAFADLSSLRVLRMSKCPNLQYIHNMAFVDPKLRENSWTIEELHLENNNLTTLPKLMRDWPPLKALNLKNNPWNCKCSLAYIIATHHNATKQSLARCKTPYERAGTLLTSIAKDFCVVTRLFNDDDDDDTVTQTNISGKPISRYSRPAVITALVIFALTLAILGATLGYLGSCLRERLRRRSSQPIKYTHIRSSIISNNA